MPSQTGIVNAALALIGGTRITSLSDGTRNANVANTLFAQVRDDLLRSHAWNFATKRLKLAQSGTAPAFGFEHAYPLPPDWLRTILVAGDEEGGRSIEHQVEEVAGQRAIVTDHDEVWLRYVMRVEDPNMMTADFVSAFRLALARDMAVSIAASNTLQANLQQQASRALARARSSDSLGQTPEQRPRGAWADVRGGSHHAGRHGGF